MAHNRAVDLKVTTWGAADAVHANTVQCSTVGQHSPVQYSHTELCAACSPPSLCWPAHAGPAVPGVLKTQGGTMPAL
jgi:hypothetical protein